MDKFILQQDSKGVWWERCFEKPPKKEIRVLARSKKQALFLAYNDIKYDKARGFGILPDSIIQPPQAISRAETWDIEPTDPVNAPTIAIDRIKGEVIVTPPSEDCPFCGRAIEGGI